MFNFDKLIFKYVEEYAEKSPESIAVIFKQHQINYRELNKRSNQLARTLREKGVKRDSLVGIYMERSINFLIALLAVFKAGGAYVPMDPDYPKQRIEYILEDSGIRMILTDNNSLLAVKEMQFKADLINVDDDSNLKGDCTNLQNINTKDDLAYVIYTSGSTGRPKGALVEHVGMMNHMFAMMEVGEIGHKEHISQNSSMCSDISVWQFLTAFVVGGTTCIYSYEEIINPEKFIKSLINDKVTILEVVPSYLNVMLMQMKTKGYRLDNLKRLFITGEAVNLRMIKEWYTLHSGIGIVNAYGPTEASDDVTLYQVPKELDAINVPIGKPIMNMNVYIVDEMMKLCKDGEKGEIYISGIGVGRGYINNPEKTSQLFMEDPFSDIPGVRMYKTGDIGIRLPDGNIEFYGRKDNQVKVRGFRIELQEIENEISSYPGIAEAVVLVKELQENNPLLYAFYTTSNFVVRKNLVEFISKNLPEHMIPAKFVELEKLPLNPIGKIDRNALQKIQIEEVNDAQEQSESHPSIENEELIRFFENNIGTSIIGEDLNQTLDEFGVNSINFIQLVVAIEAKYNIHFDEENLDFRSIETLAGLIDYINSKK